MSITSKSVSETNDNGIGRGLVIRELDSGLNLKQFNLLLFTSVYSELQMSTNIVGKVPAMD